MPAAAVTPAPIAYIKVVAVKKLVVELESFLVGIGLGVQVSAWMLFQTSQVSHFTRGFNPCLRSLDALYCCVLASQNILP